MATMIKAKQRGPHAGTLAFFVLVLIADLLAAALAYFYGATLGYWDIAFFLWCVRCLDIYLRQDLTTMILLSLFLLCTLPVIFMKKDETKCSFVCVDMILIALWLFLHFLIHAQGMASFFPNLGSSYPALPDVRLFLAYPTPIAGGVWLLFHLIFHLDREDGALIERSATAPAQQSQPVTSRVFHDLFDATRDLFDPDQEERAQVERALPAVVPQQNKLVPDASAPNRAPAVVEGTLVNEPEEEPVATLNPLWEGENKWDVFAACIRLYRERLIRLRPAMKPLRVPPGSRIFYTEKGDQVSWQGGKLVLTEMLLNPKNSQRLLTQLARALWDYNSPDLRLRRFLACYQFWSPVLLIFGIWMWIPAATKSLLGWQNWRAERVLDADRFVWALGQGELLLHQLRQMREAGKEEPDGRLPRYVERMGQLESLIKDEQRQMLALGLAPAQSLIA